MKKNNRKPKKKYVQMHIPFPVDPGQEQATRLKRIQIGGEILEKISKSKK